MKCNNRSKFIILAGLAVGILVTHYPLIILFISQAKDEYSLAVNINENHMRPMHENSSFIIEQKNSSFIIEQQNSSFIIEQQKRVSRLKSVCDSNKKMKLLGMALKNIVIDSADGITYCPIFKVASTSWFLLLLELRGKQIEQLEAKSQIQKTFRVVKNRLVPKASIGTKKVVVVRHPFERLVSCYRDKFENINKDYYYRAYGEKMVKNYRKLSPSCNASEKEKLIVEVRNMVALKKPNISMLLPNNPYANPVGPTFPEFVEYVVAKAIDDEHWRPYLHHCSMCSISYDYILKFENIYNETNEYLDHLGLRSKVSLKWTNQTKRNVTFFDIVCSYMKQLTPGLVNSLKRKYQADLLAFDYNPNKYSL